MRNVIKPLIPAAVCIMGAMCAAPVQAEVIGGVLATDIGAVIDDMPIRSYNIDGSTYIVAEDLRSYGFDVVWDGDARTLDISPNGAEPHCGMTADEINVFTDDINVGERLFDIYSSDIVTRVCGDTVQGAAIDGVTLIKLRELERCAYIGFDEKYRIASAEVTRYRTEKAYEAADKDTIALGGGRIYTGETENGVPHGTGRITETGSRLLYSTYGRSMYPLAEYKSDENYVNTYTGHFENGVMDGMFFTEFEPIVYLRSNYYNSGEEFLGRAAAAEYYSGGTLMSSSMSITVNAPELISTYKVPFKGGYYTYTDENTYKSRYFFNRIGDTESGYIEPSENRLYGLFLESVDVNNNLLRHIYREDGVRFVSCGMETSFVYAVSEDGDLYISYLYESAPVSDATFRQPVYIRRNISEFNMSLTSYIDLKSSKLLARDGKLYVITDEEGMDDQRDILVRENVKEIGDSLYLTNDGSLYKFCGSGSRIEGDAEDDILIDTNVTRMDENGYIKDDKTAWYVPLDINHEIDGETVQIGENAVDICAMIGSAAYVTESGEVFYCDMMNGNKEKIADNCVKVKMSGSRISVLGKNGSLYVMKITSDGIGEPEKRLDDVKDFSAGGTAAVTNDGRLWHMREDNGYAPAELFAHRANEIKQ